MSDATLSSHTGPATTRSAPRVDHVVVLGASLAGLLAARVFAPHARQITVVDLDDPTREPEQPRKGVPQGRHAHLLLRSGLASLCELLPGLERELETRSGGAFDTIRDTAWKVEGEFRPRFDSSYRAYAISRPVLEALVRAHATALPNVRFRYGERASGLLFKTDRVSGVTLAGGEALEASVVVDASGRGTRVPGWLEAAGFERPEAIVEKLDLTYTSCVVEPNERARRRGYRMLLIPPVQPHCPRGGLLLPIENDRYVATFVAYGDERPPLTWDSMRAWASTVDDPEFAAALADCTPVGTPMRYAIPEQIWRRYDRCSKLPKGLFVLGDALCSFDPAFGQGMSVCALEARALAQLLADGDGDLEHVRQRYVARASAIIASPWALSGSRSADRSKTRRSVAWARAYRRALLRTAAHSHRVHLAFVRVVNLEASASSLLHPRVVLAVLEHAWRTRARARHHDAAEPMLASQTARARR